jgi:hypothetical protein
MYQTFVDYDEEYNFYNTLIQEYNCKTTGNRKWYWKFSETISRKQSKLHWIRL